MTFVSAVVPTYNRKEDLKKCVMALVTQTYPQDKFEIIICDDSSIDGTKEVVDVLRSKNKNIHYLLSKENLGPAHARNLGIEKAKGEIIAFTDDDCIPASNWIEEAVKIFEKEGGLTGVDGATLPAEKIESGKKIFTFARTMNSPGPSRYPPTCNVFYRKTDLIDIGGFDEELRVAEDIDISCRLSEKNKKISFSDNVLVHHKVEYLPFFRYLRRMSIFQSYPLVVKKNPSMRKYLMLGFIVKKTHLYPIFIVLSIFFYLLSTQLQIFTYLFYIGLILSLLTFFISRVAVDKKASAYPLRTVLFIRYFLLDFTDTFYLLLGSIKHRSLVL